MHSSTISDQPVQSEHHDWESVNEAGVSFGHESQWSKALDAFLDAHSLAPSFADAPEIHAVLLSNLAQAHFRLGDTSRAVQSARQALAARLIVCEDDLDAPMARIRADLAVYLAASGEFEESEVMLSSARSSIEWRYGDEDNRLASILENQARVALATGRPAHAEPALLRLHALLAEQGDDPGHLSDLFALVGASRMRSDGFSRPAYIGASSTSDQQPEAASELFPAIAEDEFGLIEDAPVAPLRSPSARTIREAGLVEPGQHATPAELTGTNPLGFVVQYGIPQDELIASSIPLPPSE